MHDLKFYLEIITHLITIFGVPCAILVYLNTKKKERFEREYGTYDALDDKYIELQQLCLEHPSLDVFDTPFENQKERKLTEEETRQEEAILLIRISIFERAFLMYKRSTRNNLENQWEGWLQELLEWFDRKNFKKVWEIHSPYFDKEFVAYTNSNRRN